MNIISCLAKPSRHKRGHTADRMPDILLYSCEVQCRHTRAAPQVPCAIGLDVAVGAIADELTGLR